MAALRSRCGYFTFVVSSFFLFFLAYSQPSQIGCLILPHMMWPYCEFKMHVWNVLHAARWKYRTQKFAICMRTITQLCRAISAQRRHVSTVGKNLLNINASSTCRHNMVNVRPLTAEIGSLVWGTPANFDRFRVLASLLHWRRSTEVNQTLHDVWPSPGLVHYIYRLSGALVP